MIFSIPSERIFSSKKHGRKKAKGDKEAQDRKEREEAQDHQAPITHKPLRRSSERFLFSSSGCGVFWLIVHSLVIQLSVIQLCVICASIAWCLKDWRSYSATILGLN